MLFQGKAITDRGGDFELGQWLWRDRLSQLHPSDQGLSVGTLFAPGHLPCQIHDQEASMPTEIWQTPIEVAVGDGDHFKSVKNSREALATLMTCWPEKGGKSFAIAKRTCMKSLSGEAEHAAAARAFLEAAIEAGILRP
jgi:hypothetical protein